MRESDTVSESKGVAETFSTCSDEEVRYVEVLKRIEGAVTVSSLKAVAQTERNGSAAFSTKYVLAMGNITLTDDCARMYRRLNCVATVSVVPVIALFGG